MNLRRDTVQPNASRTLTRDIGRRLVFVETGIPAVDGGTPIPTEDYTYDLEENRVTSHLASGYVYDVDHKLLENSNYRYAYDVEGNLISRENKATLENWTPSWDAQDLLTSILSSDGWSIVFTYDVKGRRTSKTYIDAAGNAVETVYVYDGPNALLEFKTENGVTTSRRWLNSYGLDQRFAFEQCANGTPTPGTGIVYEIFTDHLGSVVAVVDTTTNWPLPG